MVAIIRLLMYFSFAVVAGVAGVAGVGIIGYVLDAFLVAGVVGFGPGVCWCVVYLG